MSAEVYLTKAGFEKIATELERLKNVERRRISKAIGEARLQGDLSENAEYDAAKEAQAYCEVRISELEETVANVRLIEDQNIPADKVYIGAIVTLQDIKNKKEVKYMIVSPQEADFEANKLSIFSPIGQGLLGRAPEEEVEIEVPDGKVKLRILKIERP